MPEHKKTDCPDRSPATPGQIELLAPAGGRAAVEAALKAGADAVYLGLRALTEQIRVQHLVVDLIGSPDSLGDWYNVPLPHWKTFRFHYDRTLA